MDAQTIKTYNTMAKEYDAETADFWQRFPTTFFDAFATRTGKQILDVGSGPGRDALLLNERGFNVTCLDASEAMVALCTTKGLTAILGDFMELPFADNTFNGVWAYTSLLHVPKSDVGKSVAEIARVLKNNGTFGLGLIEGDTELYRESSGMGMPRWFSFYTKDEVTRLLADHGFQIVYFEEFKPGSKNYLNFIAQKK